jgi:hypothetical protein
MRSALAILTIPLAIVAAGCGKVKEAASEKVAERAIESAMDKDGTKAQVKLSEGSARITTTDASGKTSQLEMGAANVTEAELGVPLYPGATMMEGQSTRVTTPDGTSVSIGMRSGDPPAKVAGFYRERLKAQAAGKQFTDMSGGDDSAMLALVDEKAKGAIQVSVSKAESGSEIAITAHRSAGK